MARMLSAVGSWKERAMKREPNATIQCLRRFELAAMKLALSPGSEVS